MADIVEDRPVNGGGSSYFSSFSVSSQLLFASFISSILENLSCTVFFI